MSMSAYAGNSRPPVTGSASASLKGQSQETRKADTSKHAYYTPALAGAKDGRAVSPGGDNSSSITIMMVSNMSVADPSPTPAGASPHPPDHEQSNTMAML